jgi:hypothetical protein
VQGLDGYRPARRSGCCPPSGSLDESFEHGTVIAIVERAAALLEQRSG